MITISSLVKPRLIAIVSLLLAACSDSGPATSEQLTLFLVRHAEKTTESPDPDLTDYGIRRAEALASQLGDKTLTAVYSTDFIRTQATARPTAALFDLPVTRYDPYDLAGFAAQLKVLSGQVLIVGHSNTTPELVQLLGGDPGAPIDEATEYNRLYVITITARPDAEPHVSSELLRYGPANLDN